MLWGRPDLATLQSFASAYLPLRSAVGDRIGTERWTLRFPRADTPRLSDTTVKRTYARKPLVAPFGEPLFGELAVLACLQHDGWNGVWVDTFHGKELFWREMPQRGSRVDLTLEPEALRLYRGIVAEHGKRGGFFDVFAWRESNFLFIEYKGKSDRPNANEKSWIASTIRYGIDLSHLLVVAYK